MFGLTAQLTGLGKHLRAPSTGHIIATWNPLIYGCSVGKRETFALRAASKNAGRRPRTIGRCASWYYLPPLCVT
jgi:hypothetical protein